MEFEQPIPVAVFIQVLNEHLKQLQAKVVGEVASVKRWSSGHVYFDLKDMDDESTLNCVIWKYNYQVSGIQLEDGMQIVATGRPNVYAPSGRLSFIVDTVEYAGEGELKKAYDKLKQTLASEGLFDESRKRSLPRYIQKIGVITSKQGAVIHDFENNLGRWGFQIKFIDSRVEGKEAIHDLLSAIETMKKQDIEALVIMRGGGSRASLAAFDSEALVRAIAEFPVPVIAGIGHHEDVTLSALAADINVSTPTAAAHALNSVWEDILHSLKLYESQIMQRFYHTLMLESQSLESFQSNIFQMFDSMQTTTKKDMALSWKKTIEPRFHYSLKTARERLSTLEKIITLNDPHRLLQLGYSVVRNHGSVLNSTKHVTIGDTLSIQLADGEVVSQVKEKV